MYRKGPHSSHRKKLAARIGRPIRVDNSDIYCPSTLNRAAKLYFLGQG